MAEPEDRKVSFGETSPLNDDEDLFIEEYEDDVVGCGCFRGLCFGWRRGRGRYLLKQQQRQQQHSGDDDEEAEVRIAESWLWERGRRIKEFSEVMAGPKWKNFIIRRLSSVDINNNNNNNRSKKRSKVMQFQYDPQSYKLNFDDGVHREIDFFSARYAAPIVGINSINGGDLGF